MIRLRPKEADLSDLAVQRFEPVYLEIGEVNLTEYGKRWFDRRLADVDRFYAVLRDIAKLARAEAWKWPLTFKRLEAEGVPTAVSSGLSTYAMTHVIDHVNGKTSFTMPATVAMVLATAAPPSNVTGSTVTEATYTGYARQVMAGSNFVAASGTTTATSSNVSTITFGNCTGGTNNLLGFILADSATVGAGNALWFGTLASTTISTTQTPPTVAAGAMSLSATGT
jgi:hypothetical protein